ncbi:MAG: Gfo/Idh/MocA family oxidoreductase [Actinobacteria bacterium]|nr:Gfo/Idh/MocA family oxidoreductase [Actinomycetota bacterium]
MRVGLIGAGRIGTLHAGVLTGVAAVDELVIADSAAGRAKKLAADLDAHHLDDPDEIFDSVDAVVIASSTETHASYLIKTARAGLPTFCEKPISMDLPSTDKAVAAVDESGIMVQVGFMRRFDPGYRAAHELVASGGLGDVMLVQAQTHDFEPPRAEYIAGSGGIFVDMLIHEFDILRFVTGQEVLQVSATGSSHGIPIFAEHADVATAAVTAHLDGGTLAVITGVRTDARGYDVRMELFGTTDSVTVGLDAHTPIRTLDPGLDLPQDPVTVGWLERFGPAYKAEMEAFVDAVVEDQPSPCTVDDARAALAVAEACRRSLVAERPVSVEETS